MNACVPVSRHYSGPAQGKALNNAAKRLIKDVEFHSGGIQANNLNETITKKKVQFAVV